MASPFYADNYYDPMPQLPLPCPMTRVFKYTVAAALLIEDIFLLAPLQALTGMVVKNYYVDIPDLDTGATPTLTFDLGFDGTNEEDDLVDGATVGQAVGKLTPAVNGVAGAIPKTLTTDKILQLHADAAPQTGATSGVIKGWVEYFYYSRAITL